MTERNNDVPEWLVERLAAGELSALEAASVRSRLAAAGQEERLDALRQANRVSLDEHPPQRVAAEIERRLAQREQQAAFERRSSVRLTWPLATTGAVAVCVALLLPLGPHWGSADGVSATSASPGSVTTGNDGDAIRLKGLDPHLAIYKKTSEGAALLRDGSPVAPGDVIQVAYMAAGYHYGVVLSIDSNRAVTLHLPEAAGPAVTLKPQGETALNHAFELDATSGRERFVFVTSKRPFTTDTVIDALRAGETLPPDFATTELSLQKSTP
jgi:hypothetical protein